MSKFILLFIFISLTSGLLAQFYDNHWMMGYAGGDETPPTDSFGISILSFYEAELRVENNQTIDLDFNGSGNALSDFVGDLLLFSNNQEIRSFDDQLIGNGLLQGNGDAELILPQSFIFLPFDIQFLTHYVQMNYTDVSPTTGRNLSTSFISTSQVMDRFLEIENILDDGLTTGELTACRHANGRDWWVLVPAANEPYIYSVLFNPNGVASIDTTEVDYNMQHGLGQAKFSPDGQHYVRYNKVTIGEDDYLDIFDFDRCNGQISNHRHISIGPDANSGGVAISPSSQYLYVSHYNHIFQYDLWAEDVFSTQDTVATYDGYLEWNIFHGRFFMAELAPNGKIYLNSSSGIKKLHVIESPDEGGEACNVQQHSIQLPNNNAFTLANHPNYRLGPIDGSSCDSLGIDNLPRAYYRTDRDTIDSLHFHFQDLSFYEPADWVWDFGDNTSSFERHPDHTYAAPGIYEVCLTVSNDLGTDTHCRTLDLGPVSVSNPPEIQITTFPNPVQDVLVFDLGEYLPLSGRFILHDAVGREVLSQKVLYRQARFDLSAIPAGMYYYSFWDAGVQLAQGRVLKLAE